MLRRQHNVLALTNGVLRLVTASDVVERDQADDDDALQPLPASWTLGKAVLGLGREGVHATLAAKAWVGRHGKLTLALVGTLTALAVAGLIYWELQTSGIEAAYVTSISPELTYRVEAGPSSSIEFPPVGPYDVELGYAALPKFTKRLDKAGYSVEAQARLSPMHDKLIRAGLFPIFQEKSTHGLRIGAQDDSAIYEESFPRIRWGQLQDVPGLVVTSLLFIEDRQVLDNSRVPSLNPAVSWDRLTKATIELMLDKVFSDRNVPGGSTLATQLEKFRHSEGGRTRNTKDKLKQMASATARAYLLGTDTSAAREGIVLDYINGVPLGAVPGLGEVTGIGDGLKAWYGEDLQSVTAALTAQPKADDVAGRIEHARAFKRVLSLFLSQRRPAYYLQRNQKALGRLANTYVRLMANAGLIAPQLAADALGLELGLLAPGAARPKAVQASFVERKAANAVRIELARMLHLKTLYELDRLDAEVKSTFNRGLQNDVSKFLVNLQTEDGAKAAGIVGERLLAPGQAGQVNYSFTLIERQDDRNVVRVQSDTVDSPLDLNRGGKLELGSTAKMRTLLTYLEMVSELYQQYGHLAGDKEGLASALMDTSDEDDMQVWALGWLKTHDDATLQGMLDAAMHERTFSASPYMGFRTGGGVMHFQNFESEDNGSHFTVQQAFQRSNNLVFVRVMREIVQHVIFTRIDGAAQLLANQDNPKRREYLDRFVDKESAEYLGRFYRELKSLTPAERETRLLTAKHLTTTRLASIEMTLHPWFDYYAFHLVMTQSFPKLEEKVIARYWQTIRPEVMNLNDRGYVARIHPLALWLAGFLNEHPNASLKDALASSKAARTEAYTWLYKKAGPRRQDLNIRTMLEREAFSQHIIKYWQRQGFPFSTMTPTYASALGSSGDRPSALADLMGAIYNYGVLMPTKRFDEIRFGRSTPFETAFTPAWLGARRVCSPEVAALAKEAALSVVDGGTGRRLKGTLKRSDGSEVAIAAKTGTGDNRLEIFGAGGRLIRSEKKSRTATLVFAIGDRFYGAITAYVKADGDSEVGDYTFTSSLVVQTLKAMMPTLKQTVLQVEDPWAFAIN